MSWPTQTITLNDGRQVDAKLPVILSASRATDIPAFYMDWFMKQLKQGYTSWKNPYNGKHYWYSFERTRVIVFWSKNPAPLIPYINCIHQMGYRFYLQFTLNDYEQENYEPGLPPLQERIATFKHLAALLGPDYVVWRFDPLFLTHDVTIPDLLRRIDKTGNALYGHTKRLTFSFADIEKYRKVKRNLQKLCVTYKTWNEAMRQDFARQLHALNKQWHYELTTCAEPDSFAHFGISPGKCVDDGLMAKLFYDDKPLMDFLGRNGQQMLFNQSGNPLKDKGQRKSCNCIVSKDIGQYNTCKHGCVYCYANQYQQAGH